MLLEWMTWSPASTCVKVGESTIALALVA